QGALALGGAGLEVQFAGIAGIKEPFGLQGETTVAVASLSKTAQNYGVSISPSNDTAVLKGLMTASAEKVSFTDMTLNLAGYDFAGAFSGGLNPLVIKSRFTGSDTVNIDQFLPKGGAAQKAQGQQQDIAALLP